MRIASANCDAVGNGSDQAVEPSRQDLAAVERFKVATDCPTESRKLAGRKTRESLRKIPLRRLVSQRPERKGSGTMFHRPQS